LNIVCDKTLLSAAIDGVSKAVTMRSAIPVLEGILLKAEGFQLTLTGYDLEMGIVTTIEANVKEPGEIVLNAKLLSSMISRMPAGQISILSADNGKTTIKSGVAEFEIQSMAATDFPDLPNTGDPDHPHRRTPGHDRPHPVRRESGREKTGSHRRTVRDRTR